VRVLFCHQSVGANLVQGLREQLVNGFAGSILPMDDGAASQSSVLLHGSIGQNGDPLSKLRDFEIKLTQGAKWALDLALMKFCYVDVTEQQAAERLLSEYSQCVERLGAGFSAVKVGHVTVPLRAAPSGMLARARQAIQGPHVEHRRNTVRCWFNEQLRQKYGASGLLFDLAAAESRQRNGRTAFSIAGGQSVHSLAREWTDDGGHLNADGRKMAAQAFLNYLRNVERQGSKAGSLDS